jgi:hypothetical protein
MRAVIIVIALLDGASAIDFGPTYGEDYAGKRLLLQLRLKLRVVSMTRLPLLRSTGLDYNVTPWHSDPSKSANHWEAAAAECEQLCFDDEKCCTWTYCTPEGGPNDPERCCLKDGIPAEVAASTHWTGAAPRANTSRCTSPPPPPWPGQSFMKPMVRVFSWAAVFA